MTNDQRDPGRPDADDAVDRGRRQSLKQIGGLAASVAPAMVVLVKAQDAAAHHNGRPSRPDQPGHAGGPPCWDFPGSSNSPHHSAC